MGKLPNQLSKADINFVLSRCPRDIVKLLAYNPGKLFLAGGFIRSTISGEKVSDIDLFGDTAESLKEIAIHLAYNRKGRYFETKNAITVLAPPRMPVQFITRWLFSDPIHCVNSFDYTVCQAAIWAVKEQVDSIDDSGALIKKDKISFHSVVSGSFYSDLAARRLVYTFPVREEESGGSFMRMLKFIKRGYNIQAPSMAGVMSRIFMKIDQKVRTSGDEKYIATIITGLIRQVDPLIVIDGVDFLDEHEIIEGL